MMRKFFVAGVATALLGSSSVLAAAPVMPSVAKLSAPMVGANLGVAQRAGARKAKGSALAGATPIVLAVLAAGAVAGGVVAATDNGNGHSASP